MKKLFAISLLTAAGLFAQATTPANPPDSNTPAPAKTKKAKKHHDKKAKKSTTPTPAPAEPSK